MFLFLYMDEADHRRPRRHITARSHIDLEQARGSHWIKLLPGLATCKLQSRLVFTLGILTAGREMIHEIVLQVTTFRCWRASNVGEIGGLTMPQIMRSLDDATHSRYL